MIKKKYIGYSFVAHVGIFNGVYKYSELTNEQIAKAVALRIIPLSRINDIEPQHMEGEESKA